MPTTPIIAAPYPLYTPAADVPADLNAALSHVEKYVVSRFASEAARDTAIPAPVDGMVAYVTGIGLMYRDGTWKRQTEANITTGTPTMGTNWTAGSPTPKVTRVGDTVHVEGLANVSANATTATNNVICTLPSGFRPPGSRAISAHANPGPILLSVLSTGNVVISSLYGLTNVPSGGFVYLDSLTFRV